MKRHKIFRRRGRYLRGIWLAGRPRTVILLQRDQSFGEMLDQVHFSLQVSMLKSDKIWRAYLVVNFIGLRTFWMPLVHVVVCSTGSLLLLRPSSPSSVMLSGQSRNWEECSDVTSFYIEWLWFVTPWLTHRHTDSLVDRYSISLTSRAKNSNIWRYTTIVLNSTLQNNSRNCLLHSLSNCAGIE